MCVFTSSKNDMWQPSAPGWEEIVFSFIVSLLATVPVNRKFTLVYVECKCIVNVERSKKRIYKTRNVYAKGSEWMSPWAEAGVRAVLQPSPSSVSDCTSVSTRRSRGVSNTGQPWLFSPAAAPAWLGGRSWTGRRPPGATRTCPAGSPISSTAAASWCVVIVLQRVNVDCLGRFHVNVT